MRCASSRLGPNNVARFLGDIANFRLDYATDYTRNKIRWDEMLNDDEEKRQLAAKKRAHNAMESTDESSASEFDGKKRRLDRDAVFAAADAFIDAAEGGILHRVDADSNREASNES